MRSHGSYCQHSASPDHHGWGAAGVFSGAAAAAATAQQLLRELTAFPEAASRGFMSTSVSCAMVVVVTDDDDDGEPLPAVVARTIARGCSRRRPSGTKRSSHRDHIVSHIRENNVLPLLLLGGSRSGTTRQEEVVRVAGTSGGSSNRRRRRGERRRSQGSSTK